MSNEVVKFEHEDIVYGMVTGYPWWPGFISLKISDQKYQVTFFGDFSYAPLKTKYIRSFDEEFQHIDHNNADQIKAFRSAKRIWNNQSSINEEHEIVQINRLKSAKAAKKSKQILKKKKAKQTRKLKKIKDKIKKIKLFENQNEKAMEKSLKAKKRRKQLLQTSMLVSSCEEQEKQNFFSKNRFGGKKDSRKTSTKSKINKFKKKGSLKTYEKGNHYSKTRASEAFAESQQSVQVKVFDKLFNKIWKPITANFKKSKRKNLNDFENKF